MNPTGKEGFSPERWILGVGHLGKSAESHRGHGTETENSGNPPDYNHEAIQMIRMG
jgi:hypothetical protein